MATPLSEVLRAPADHPAYPSQLIVGRAAPRCATTCWDMFPDLVGWRAQGRGRVPARGKAASPTNMAPSGCTLAGKATARRSPADGRRVRR